MDEKEGYEEWLEFLDNGLYKKEVFYKFAILWLSFNSYLNKICPSEKGDKEKVKKFAKEEKTENFYQNLKEKEFQKILDDFSNTDDSIRTSVDVLTNPSKKRYFDPEKNLAIDFFMVLYQIRCNFFHGNKIPSNKNDEKLVGWAYNALHYFWKIYVNKYVEETKDKNKL